MKNKRMIGFELLRIIAMFLICCVHLMNAGGMIENSQGAALYSQYLLYAFFLISVNVFVLITGYFMVKSKVSARKIFFLWLEVMAYSVMTYLVTNIFFDHNFNFKEFLFCFFPILFNKYWFFTAYFLLYISIPILNKIFIDLEKRTANKIVIFVFVLSYIATRFNASSVISLGRGYTYLWFLALYLLGACLRLYPLQIKKTVAFVVYIICTLLVFCFTFIPQNLIFIKLIYNTLDYNSPLVVLASVSVIYLLKDIDINNKIIRKIICYLSSCTFGIYLYHCSVFFPSLVFRILKIQRFFGNNYSVLYVLLFALIIFIIGVIVDSFRKLFVFCIRKLYFKAVVKTGANCNGC